MEKHNFKRAIENEPRNNFSIAVVIPCFNEPDIIATLSSLRHCELPSLPLEIIVVLNYPEGSEKSVIDFHNSTLVSLNTWRANNSDEHLACHIINAPALPKKFAGVGQARKIGMDEAIYRFSLNNNEGGIICGFDADATVDTNYLRAVEEHFITFPKSPGASVYFEHPVESIADARLRSGIVQYETHLRYLVNANRYAGFPYSFHTVGSSFAVRAMAYVKQGGMNRFKAGEDFYFINKIIPLGGYTEINTTRVIPQARVSGRVPFGTGASMMKWMDNDQDDLLTYQLDSYFPLARLFSSLEKIYIEKAICKSVVDDSALWDFLSLNDSGAAVNEIINNSSSFSSFARRFFNWFDAFRIVKYLNHAATQYYPKQPVKTEALRLLRLQTKVDQEVSNDALMDLYRRWDRHGNAGVNLQQ